MSCFLVIAPPFPGHVNRIVPVAEELAARGHRVSWVAFPGLVGHLLPDGAEVFAPPDEPARRLVGARRAQAAAAPSARALGLGSVDEMLVPLAEAMVPTVEEATGAVDPDCLVADVACLAGALVARRRGLPWATSSEPAIAVLQGLGDLVHGHGAERLDALQRSSGLDPVPRPYWSPHLVLVNSVRELVGDAVLDPAVRLVGATFERPRRDVPFPWERLGEAPLVYVTLGTTIEHLGARFLRALLDGLAEEQVQVLAAVPPHLVPDAPPNALLLPYVPQDRLLPRAAAVVTHCGHSTLAEVLAHGRPLVAAPVAYDQPWNAARAVAAGAGVQVRFRRSSAAELREAVRDVLGDGRYAGAARRLGDALAAAGGARTAADHLEALTAVEARA